MNTFQLILLVVFGALGVIAVFIFSGIIPLPGGGGGQVFAGEVVLWGTIPQDAVVQFVNDFNAAHADVYSVRYVQKNADTFQDDLISALASGKGPDLAILPHDLLVQDSDKLTALPYASLSARDFQDAFADEGALFLGTDGALALALYVDPLVMYWNRDLLASGGVALPPVNWEDVPLLAQTLTKQDDRGNITQSAIALGGTTNIPNAKEILSALVLQVGEKITARDETGALKAVFGGENTSKAPATEALRFYSDFSNPAKTVYSWNSALPSARTAFEGGTLALYFGMASEQRDIVKKNPHLNFDVAVIPQHQSASLRATFGRMYGIGVLKNSKNMTAAFRAAIDLTSAENGGTFATAAGLAPARRALLAVSTKNPSLDVFNRASIMSRGWLDPNPPVTEKIFTDMVQSVIINKTDAAGAVAGARGRLDAAIGR